MPKDKIIRGCGYTRRSDPRKEANFSLGFQKDKIVEHCHQMKIALSDDYIFSDKYTGQVWRERKGLQAVFEAAKRHEIDVVIAYRLDRFSRDHIDQIVIREQLKYYGVRIVTLDPEEHADDESLSGQIVRAVYAFQAEIERKKILERCNDGREKRVKNGHLLTGNHPLFGYDWMDKAEERDGEQFVVKKSFYVINAKQAKIVVWMFEMAAEGVALRRIALLLTDEGITTPTGNAVWTHNSVRYILTHPYYKGLVAVFKRAQEFIPEVGAKRHYRPESEWKSLPDGVVPAIVSEELWERVQRRIVSNRELSPRKMKDPESALLRGRIYCGHCGGKMTIGKSKRNGVYYICQKVKGGLKGHRGCNNGTIVTHIADAEAWTKAKEVILQPEVLDAELAKRKEEDPTKDEIATLDAVLADIIPRIINLTTTIETTPPGAAQAVLILRLDELEKQRLDIEDRRDKIKRRTINWQKAQQAVADFKAWCEQKRPSLATNTYKPTFQEKQTALSELGMIVRVFRKDYEEGDRMLIGFSPPSIMSVLCTDRVIYLTGRNLRS